MLVQSLLDANRKYGPVVAVDDGFRSLTYRQVTALASVMKDLIERRATGDRIGLLLPASAAFPGCFFGTIWAGRTPVPLNLLLNPEELRAIVEDAEISWIITIRHFAKLVEALPGKKVFLEELPLKRRLFLKLIMRPPRVLEARPDDVAVILYTSGTTGVPKGVQLTHANLLSNCEDCIQVLNLQSGTRFLNVLPPFHVLGLMGCVIMPVLIGGSVYAIPRFHPLDAVRKIAEKSITLIVAIPSMYAAMLKTRSATREMLSTIELAISGGEPLPDGVFHDFKERFGVELFQGYGLTETSPVISVAGPGQQKVGAVGRPLPRVKLEILDLDRRPCPVGADGEIIVSGPGIMKGYLNKPEETQAVLDHRGRFHTGDMGRLDADGFLTISGRIKDMLIVSGENVYPREIEAVLEEHPGVLQAAVIGMADESRGELPVAFVLKAQGAQVTEADLRAFARRSLAGFKVPRKIIVAEELPTGPTGKILKRKLREML